MLQNDRIGDVVARERARLFVGREAERRLFAQAILMQPLPFNLLFLVGPGGIGKTTLLHLFAEICARHGVACAMLDARSLNLSSPPAIEQRPEQTRQVLLLDAYEDLAETHAAERAIREQILAQLSAATLIVIASRQPPTLEWHADPGWRRLMQVLPLRNLSPAESRTYLSLRAVAPHDHERALAFTHGHPLALSLVADLADARAETTQAAGLTIQADLIAQLLTRLLDRVPDASHRAALELAALIQTTNEDALSEVLGLAHASDLFAWLRRRSFVEERRAGIVVHDLVREAILADLRWRNPSRFAELRERAGRETFRRLQQSADQQQRIMVELTYLYRHSPIFATFMPLDPNPAGMVMGGAQAEDIPPLLALVAHHEGPESALVAEEWFARQPQSITVFREPRPGPNPIAPNVIAGFCCVLMLDAAQLAAAEFDPHARAVWRYLQTHTPLLPGERVSLGRFWLARDTHQQISPLTSACFVLQGRQYLLTPELAFSCNYFADPAPWQQILTFADFALLPDADYTIDGRRCQPVFHDWRVRPPHSWLELVMSRMASSDSAATRRPGARPPQLSALSRPDFDRAVRDALRDLDRLERLARNPLIYARCIEALTAPRAAERERATALRQRLLGLIDTLQTTARDRKLHQAIQLAFVQPAPSHKHAAQTLHVSLSTFRRDMRAGAARIAGLLWLDEA